MTLRKFTLTEASRSGHDLEAARRNAGLPDYQAHDALSDAVSTAELFLWLRQKLQARKLRELR